MDKAGLHCKLELQDTCKCSLKKIKGPGLVKLKGRAILHTVFQSFRIMEKIRGWKTVPFPSK